jgi:hypothetical protein
MKIYIVKLTKIMREPQLRKTWETQISQAMK